MYVKPEFRCEKRPRKKLFVLDDVGAKELRIVPLTTKVVKPTAQTGNIKVSVDAGKCIYANA